MSFTRAHAIFPNARSLRGMGMAAFELRRYEDSVNQLEAALASSVNPLEGKLREDTDSLLHRAREYVATVRLQTIPHDARVRIDGVPISRTRTGPLLVRMGEHVFEAHAPGYSAEQRTVLARGGEELPVQFVLRRELLATGSAEPVRRSERRARLYKNPWLWVTVAAVVTGSLAAGFAFAAREHADSGASSGVTTPPERTVTPPPPIDR